MRTGGRAYRQGGLVLCAAALACACALSGVAAAEEEGAPSPAEQLLECAPKGTWGVLAVDVAQVLASGPMKGARNWLPAEVTGTRAAAFFLPPGELPFEEPPPWCGIISMDPASRPAWEKKLAEDGEKLAIEGLSVYGTWDGIQGFAADDALLMGGDQETFKVLLAAYRAAEKPGLDEKLAGLVRPYAGGIALGAMAVPGTGRFADLIPAEEAEDVPAYLRGASAAAFGARLAENLTVSGLALLGSPEDAQAALAAARERVAWFKERMEETMQAQPTTALSMQRFLTILDSLKMEAKGAEIHGGFEMDRGQFATLSVAAVMPLIMSRRRAGTGAKTDLAMDGGAYESEIVSALATVRSASRAYKAEHGQYPTAMSDLTGGKWPLLIPDDFADLEHVSFDQFGIKAGSPGVGEWNGEIEGYPHTHVEMSVAGAVSRS